MSNRDNEEQTSGPVKGEFISPPEVEERDEWADALPAQEEFWRPPVRFADRASVGINRNTPFPPVNETASRQAGAASIFGLAGQLRYYGGDMMPVHHCSSGDQTSGDQKSPNISGAL